MKSNTKKLVFVILLALVSVASSFAQSVSLYSNTGGGNWSNPDTWTKIAGGLQPEANNTRVPGDNAGNKVYITSGNTVVYTDNENVEIATLDVKGVLSITGNGSINVSSLTGTGEIRLSSFSKLKVSGSDLTTFSGTITLTDNVTIGTGSSFGKIVVNNGVATIDGILTANGVTVNNGASLVFKNQAGNVLNVEGDIKIDAGGVFTADGTNENIVNVKGNLTNNGGLGCEAPSGGESVVIPQMTEDIVWGVSQLLDWNPGIVIEDVDWDAITNEYCIVVFYNQVNSGNVQLYADWERMNENADVIGSSSCYRWNLGSVDVSRLKNKRRLRVTGQTAEVTAVYITKDPDVVIANYTGGGSSSSSAQSAKLTFQFSGTSDAVYRNNGTASLYRIRGQKNQGSKITVTNRGTLDVFAETYNIKDYRNLPWSVSSGTLALGEGVVISEWGVPGTSGLTYNDKTAEYLNCTTNGYPLYVPEGATLQIAGAEIHVGKRADDNGKYGGVVISGNFVMSSGSLDLCDYSPGIIFNTGVSTPTLTVDGGVINTSVISSYADKPATFNINNGTVNFKYSSKRTCAKLSLSKGSVFAMSSGDLNFYEKGDDNNSYGQINGIWLADATIANVYPSIDVNVTGGDINVIGTSGFEIFANGVTFYNLNIKKNGSSASSVTLSNLNTNNTYWADNNFRINNLVIEDNCGLDASLIRLGVSGDIQIGSNVSLTVPDGGFNRGGGQTEQDSHNLVFIGRSNASYKSLSRVDWKNVEFQKTSNSVLNLESDLNVNGNIQAEYNGKVQGNIKFYGSSRQSIKSENSILSRVNLFVNNGAGVILASDVELSSVVMSVANRFSLGNFNLKLHSYPTSTAGWSVDNMFYTDNSSGAKGLTLPAKNNHDILFPIGNYNGSVYHYSQVEPKYSGSDDDFITVTPVYGAHPMAKKGNKNNEKLYHFYWIIDSTVGSVAGDGDTYSCRAVGLAKNEDVNGNPKVAVIVNGTINTNNTGSYSSPVLSCRKYTSGIFTVAGAWAGNGNFIKTYYTTRSGVWSDAIWTTDPSSNTGTAQNISSNDNVIIRSGHTVTCNTVQNNGNYTNKPTVGMVTINEGGVFVIYGSIIDQSTIGELKGDGKLQINYSTFKLPNTDCTEFYNSTKSTLVYLVNSDNDYWQGSYDYVPNLEIISENEAAHNFRWVIKGSVTTAVRGNLTIGKGVSFVASTNGSYGIFEVQGNTNVQQNATIGIGNSEDDATSYITKYAFKGNINNSGTIKSNGKNDIDIYGRIVNNNVINLSLNRVFVKGDQHTMITGSATYGQTILGKKLTLSKSSGNIGISAQIPVCDNNRVCPLYIETGTFSHQFNNRNGSAVIYKGDDNFDIPAGSAFSVLNGNVCIYTPAGNHVILGGDLTINNSSILVGKSESTPTYGSIQYISGSKIRTYGTSARLSDVYLCSLGGESGLDINSRSTQWNFESGTMPQNYGAFDIREGSSVAFDESSKLVINTISSASNSTIYYHPTSSDFKAEIQMNKDGAIDALSPLANVVIDNGANVSIENSPLTVATLDVKTGSSFNCQSIDLSLKKDFKVADTQGFTAGSNTIYFIGGSETQNIETSSDVNVNNLICRSAKLTSNHKVNVQGNFTLDNGVYVASEELNCKGSVDIRFGTSIIGDDGIHLIGTSEQVMSCEGKVDFIEINNVNGVNATSPQSSPIYIGKELRMTNGCLRIGGNVLEIASEANITAGNLVNTFGTDRMIVTNASYTDRGIRVNLAANTPKSIILPLGEGSKYTPVEFDGITSSLVGSVTVFSNNGVHFTVDSDPSFKYNLKYYWSFTASAGVNVTAGSISMTDNAIEDVFVDSDSHAEALAHGESDDYKYETDLYQTAVLNGAKFLKNSGTVSYDGSSAITLSFDFSPSSSDINGVYTAGRPTHLPDKVDTYISVKDGNWNDAIWKLVGEDGNPVGDLLNAPKNGHGFYIGAGTNVVLDPATDNRQRVYFLEIQEDASINFKTTSLNNMGTVTGTGKIIVENSSALPGGNYEGFFGSDGGTIEYAGNTDYSIFVGIPRNNNVILSGSGKRMMPNSNDVVIYGSLSFANGDATNDDFELVMAGKNVYIGGDLTFNTDYQGSCSGSGCYIFNGTVAQHINAVSPIEIQGLGIENAAGLTINQDVAVDKLILNRGIITLANGGVVKTMTLGETSTIESITGFTNTYIDGKLARYVTNNVPTSFYVGNKSAAGSRNGSISVEPYGQSGLWTVRYINSYYNATIDEIRGTDQTKPIYKVETIGNEYWEVEGPGDAKAKVKMRWDSNSGYVADKTKVVSKEADSQWSILSYRDPSQNPTNGTLVTYPYTTKVSGGPRVYMFATSETSGTYTWVGAFGPRWDAPGNWGNQMVPGGQSDVSIPVVDIANNYSYPVIDASVGSAFAGTLTIVGGELTVEGAGTTFTINGNVKITSDGPNVGVLNLNYKYNSNPNFILNGDIVAGDVTVNRTIRAGRIYYMGSATDNTRIQTPRPEDNCKYSNLYMKRFNHTDVVAEFTKSGVNAPMFVPYGKLSLAETLGSVGLFISSSKELTPGEDCTLWQSGKVAKTEEYEIEAFLGSNWYSNPYPFALNVNAISVDKGSVNPTLYSRVCSGDMFAGVLDLSDESWKYETFNIEEGVGTFNALAPFQGFELICDDASSSSSNKSTVLKVAPTPYTAAPVMQKSAIIDPNKGKVLRLYAGSNGYTDQLVLLFNERGEYVMGEGDSYKKPNPSPEFFSEISTNKGMSSLVISRFPEVETMVADKSRLPINITKATNATDVAVWIGNLFEFDYDGAIYLIDHLTEEYVNLSEVFEYICPEPDNLYNGRFELSFVNEESDDIATSIEGTLSDSNRITITSNVDGIARITIFGDVKSDAKVVLYDILGRVIREKSISNATTDINVPKTGVFVVKVVNGNESRTSKIML